MDKKGKEIEEKEVKEVAGGDTETNTVNTSNSDNSEKKAKDAGKDRKGLLPGTEVGLKNEETGPENVRGDYAKTIDPASAVVEFISLMNNSSRLICSSRGLDTGRDVFHPLKFLCVDPLEYKFETVTGYPSRMKFSVFGTARRTYMLRQPMCEPKYTSWDEYLRFAGDCMEMCMSEAMKILYVDQREVYQMARIEDVSKRGFPYDEICHTSVDLRALWDILTPQMTLSVPIDQNWREVNVISQPLVGAMRTELILYGGTEVVRIRDFIEKFLSGVNEGVVPAEIPHVAYMNSVYNVCADPRDLMLILPKIPHALEFSMSAIIDLLSPKIFLRPMPQANVNSAMWSSMSVSSSLAPLISVTAKPKHEAQISDWMSSLLCPGTVRFQYGGQDRGLSCEAKDVLYALCARLLFNYDANPRYSQLSETAAREIDRLLVKHGISAGIFEPLTNAVALGEDAWPFETVRGKSVEAIDAITRLRTDANGNGWRDYGVPRVTADIEPNANLYPGVMHRRNYGVNCSDRHAIKRGNESIHKIGWRAYAGVSAYLGALKCKSSHSELRTIGGLRNIFEAWALRLVRFYIQLNHYLKLHWYTSFRPMETDFGKLFDLELQNQKESMIQGETMLVMLTHLDGLEQLERVNDPIHQIKAESRIVMETLKLKMRYSALLHANRVYGLNINEWGQQSRIRLFVPEDFVLSYHFLNMEAKSPISQWWRQIQSINLGRISNIFRMAERVFQDTPEVFGIIPRYIYRQYVAQWTIQNLLTSCEDSRYLINNDGPAEDVVDWDCRQLVRSSLEGRAILTIMEQSRPNGLGIKLPIRFKVCPTNVLMPSKAPFKLIIPDIGRRANEREIMTFSCLEKSVVFLDLAKKEKLDTVIAELSAYESNYVDERYVDYMFMEVSDFLGSLSQEFTNTRILQNGHFQYFSVYDMYRGGLTGTSP